MRASMSKRQSIKGMVMAMVLVILTSLFGALSPQSTYASGEGITYYVDSQGGSDDNDGKSPSTPWKSLSKVNEMTFQPGDRILLKAGSEWTGEQLYPKGSGESGKPITIDMYGEGPKPKLNGAGAVESVVYFYNQQYWDIRNLEITNTAEGAPADPSKLGDFRGIHVTGQDAGVLTHFHLSGLFVHDVTGWVKWIGGDPTKNVPGSGIYYGAGWDDSKRTGAVVFEILQPGETPIPTKFDNVIIENSVFQDNSFGGIIFKQYEGDVHWASRDDGLNHPSPDDPLGQWYDPEWFPHTNITIRNNYFSQYNSDFACNTIYLTSVQNALIEHNVSGGAGTSAIEMYYTDNITVQYNEIFDTKVKAGGSDSNAIDPDKESTNILIQYNYIHDTGDAILLCGILFGDAIVRYNVIKDASPGKKYINPHGDKGTQLIYNNVFYNTRSGSSIDFVNSSGGSKFLNQSDYQLLFYNNIFYNADTTGTPVNIATGRGTTYDHNLYYGPNVTPPSDDVSAILSDPMFIGPIPNTRGDATTGPILNITGFGLQSGSPAIGSGLVITDNGGKDFAGRALYNGKPDIGAFEYYGDPSSTTEAITGYVKDAVGNPIAGAEVSVTVGGTKYSAVSNDYGFYSILNVPVGNGYTVVASKENYLDGTVENVNVVAGDTTSGVDLVVTSTNPTGTIEGTVRDTTDTKNPPAVAEATVTVCLDDTVYGTATTDASGHFSISGLPAQSGYIVTVSKTGYQTWTVTMLGNSPLKVDPGATTSIGDVYLSPGKPNYLLNDNFDSYDTGTVPDGWTVTATVPGGSVGVADYPSSSNKSILISQPTKGTSGKKTSFYMPLDRLSGIVTVEFSVNKSNTTQYFNVPMIYGDSPSHMAVTIGMDDTGMIIYKDGGASGVPHIVQSYSANTWYDFKIVLNTISKKFDLYIDNVKKVEQASFRFADSTTDYLTGIEFWSNYNVMGSVYVDNVRICSGIAYPRNDADLAGLEVSTGTLRQIDPTHYTLDVPNYVNQIMLTPTADSIFAKEITVDGNAVTSGQASQSIALSEGENVILVVVTAEDGTTKKMYTVTIYRTPADIDATLQNLTVSSGTLVPDFKPDTTDYTVTVPYGVSEISFTPTASVANATITLNGAQTPNGQPSASVPLDVGDNTVTITVRSTDGTNFMDYTVIVTREPNPSGILKGTVKDQSGNPVAGATVTVKGNGNTYTTITNEEGAYTFDNVYPGSDYMVTASKPGFEDGTVSGVNAVANMTTEVSDIILKPAGRGNNNGNGNDNNNNNNGNNSNSNNGSSGNNNGNGNDNNNNNNGNNSNSNNGSSGNENRGIIVLSPNNQGVATLSESSFYEALSSAGSDLSAGKVVQIEIQKSEATNQYGLLIPVSLLQNEENEYDIQIGTELGTIRLKDNMLNNTDIKADFVEIRMTKVNEIDAHPVIDLQMLEDGIAIPWSNLEAPVTVSIPYVPTPTELQNPDHIAVFYIDPQGNRIPVPSGHYDAETGQVVFTTTHFSQYAIMFNDVAFTDLSGVAWAEKAIDVLAAKGVIEGKNQTTYDPQSSITRAEFITFLMRALDLPQTTLEGFKDVEESKYYYQSLASAKSYGIAKGTGDNLFEPDKQITREDTMVLAARALQILGQQPDSSSKDGDLTRFQDADDIAEYAKDSVSMLVAAGIIQGDGAGIRPKDNLSRAEAAVIIYRLLRLLYGN